MHLRVQVVSKLETIPKYFRSTRNHPIKIHHFYCIGSAATAGATTSTSGQNASGGNGEAASGSTSTTTAAADSTANAATNSTSQTAASLG